MRKLLFQLLPVILLPIFRTCSESRIYESDGKIYSEYVRPVYSISHNGLNEAISRFIDANQESEMFVVACLENRTDTLIIGTRSPSHYGGCDPIFTNLEGILYVDGRLVLLVKSDLLDRYFTKTGSKHRFKYQVGPVGRLKWENYSLMKVSPDSLLVNPVSPFEDDDYLIEDIIDWVMM